MPPGFDDAELNQVVTEAGAHSLPSMTTGTYSKWVLRWDSPCQQRSQRCQQFGTLATFLTASKPFSSGTTSLLVRHLKSFGLAADGSAVINVSQQDYWGSAEGRYRFWDAEFSPYVSLGAGGIFQNVKTTQIMGSTFKNNGLFDCPRPWPASRRA